ncbi:helix-turn-helix domain-containing protein, partial [Blastomonas sp. CCH3-A3]|uniref:helix-turn-helix domain-containing protein n=1 Tax=Blastomonas sp. CCH3-A3 TaxID=1768733 RepID=UPI0019228EBB
PAAPKSPPKITPRARTLTHAGEIVSRDDLLHAIWQTPFDPGTNSVEVHVCKLRRRLAGMADRIWIETVRHRGYRLVRASASGG